MEGSPTEVSFEAKLTFPKFTEECQSPSVLSGQIIDNGYASFAASSTDELCGWFTGYDTGWYFTFSRGKFNSVIAPQPWCYPPYPTFNALTDQQNIGAEYSGCVPTNLSIHEDGSVPCAWWLNFYFYSRYSYPPAEVYTAVGPLNESQLMAGVALNNWYGGRGNYFSFEFKIF
jgi:hypothetical protein